MGGGVTCSSRRRSFLVRVCVSVCVCVCVFRFERGFCGFLLPPSCCHTKRINTEFSLSLSLPVVELSCSTAVTMEAQGPLPSVCVFLSRLRRLLLGQSPS